MGTDDDIESYLDPVSLNRAVRGGDKLQGVQPELLSHWNNLQGEFAKAGLTPEIKSGFRTAQQQQSLYNNPRTRALTKGNDGINRLSPHQEGRALDISFPATQRAKGRQVIADYAQRNGLTVPSDEPWHVAIPRQGKAGVELYLDPQQPAQSTQPIKPASSVESYLDPQEPVVAGRGAAMARAQGSRQPVTRGAQRKVEQGWDGGGIIGQGVSSVSVNAMGGSQPSNGVGGLRQIDDPETSRIIRAQRQVTAEQTPAERAMQRAPGTADARLFDPRLSENEEVLRRVAAEKDQEAQIAKQTAWEQENKAEIDRHVADYRKQIQDSGFTKWLTETQAKGASSLMEFGAGAANTIGAQQAANAMRVRAVAAAQAAQEEGAGRTEASKFAQDIIGGFAGSAPELLLMQAGVPPIATFAAGGGLRAKGMGRPVAPAVTQGALTGAAFEIPEAGAPGVRGTLTRAGKVGAATAGVDLATGAPVGQALKSGVVNAAMVAVPGLITKGRAPEVTPQSESRTVVPDITAQLAAREAMVKPVTDAQGNTLLNPDEVAAGGKPRVRLAQRGTDEAQVETQPNVAAQPESAQPAQPNLGTQRALEAPAMGNNLSVEQSVQGAGQGSEQRSAKPVRHVDLQKRADDGTFDEETPAQAEARRAQVAQSVSTPQPDLSTQAQPAIPDTTNLPTVPPVGAASEVAPPPVPEGKPSEPTVSPIKPEPSTTSARKAQMSEDRATLDLPELPPAERKSWQVSLGNAKPERASLLADEVLTKPRALNDEETASLVVRAQQIKNEHSQVMKELGNAKDSEDIATKRAQSEALEREFDRITRATKASGTEKGRTLAAQKLTINQDYDLVSVLQRMKAAKGRELTADERTKYADMVKERDQALVDRDAALERAHTAELQKQINKSVRQRKRSETKESLDAEAATIKTNIAAEFARLKSAQSSVHSAFGLGSLDPEGVITKELVKYARNRVKANVGLKAEALIDEVHDLVKDFASRRQVAEVLSGYMKPRDTREVDATTKQLADIRKEIAKGLAEQDIEAGTRSESPQGPSKRFVSRNTTRLKQLQAKEADLTARMAAGDYGARPRTQPLPYNREVNSAQTRVKQIERQFNEEAAKRAPKTIGDYLVRWKRFAVLGFPSTIGKLGSAATGRMAATPLYEIVGEGLRRVPGLKSAFQDVPRSTLAGERAAISQLWQSESFKDILRHLKGGDDMISLLYGEGGGDEFVQRSSSGRSVVPKSFDELMDRPGHLHAAVKVIPKRAAIFRAFENLLRHEQAKPNGRDVSDPAVQIAIMGEAYPESQRAILQQRNPVSSLFNRVIQSAANSDSRMARGLGKALQFQYPITKVPVNFVGETALHIGGLPAGLGEIALRGVSGKMKELLRNRGETMQKVADRLPDAVADLKPEERVRIARALKTGSVGLGFVIWGMMRPDQFGGYYQPEKHDPKDVKFGGMRFMGINVPRWMGHIPPLEAAQFGATLRRVYDSMSEKGKSKAEAVKGASIAGTRGMAEEIPFIDPLVSSAHGVGALLGKEGERTKFLGGEAVAMVPGSLRQGAKTLDYPKGGSLAGALNPFGSQEPVKREEQTVGQIVRGGIPGLRQTVPEKNSSGKLLNSRSGNDPLVKELMRIDHQVNGVSKSPDESQSDFEKRRAAVNPQIEADLKDLVDSREYKSLSDADKKEQITMHLRSVTKTANENYYLQNGGEKVKTPRQVYIAPQRTVAP